MGLTLNDSEQSEYIFSARTENGPVTPRIVKGWMEKLTINACEPRTLRLESGVNLQRKDHSTQPRT